MIPFLDLQPRPGPQHDELLHAVHEVIDSGIFVNGRFLEKFEADFAAYCGTKHAVGVGNGTEALWLTMAALGVGPGDEVITTPNGFAATVEAICLAGATPVFVDVEESTYTMDPNAVEAAVTHRTRAIIPVHLFGQPADMASIHELARQHEVHVIEDAAQAHGAGYRGHKTGSLGDAACFSFYPSKNLGAFGEGGAIVTNRPELAARLRMLRDHGQSRKNHHSLVGWNSRLDEIQAAVLYHKLHLLDENNARRRLRAAQYHHELEELPGITLPREAPHRFHVYHIYAIRTRYRQQIIRAFDQQGIGHGIHYPVPIHLQPAYRMLGHVAGDFPVTEKCACELLSLPMFPNLTREQVSAVTDTIRLNVGTCVPARNISFSPCHPHALATQ